LTLTRAAHSLFPLRTHLRRHVAHRPALFIRGYLYLPINKSICLSIPERKKVKEAQNSATALWTCGKEEDLIRMRRTKQGLGVELAFARTRGSSMPLLSFLLFRNAMHVLSSFHKGRKRCGVPAKRQDASRGLELSFCKSAGQSSSMISEVEFQEDKQSMAMQDLEMNLIVQRCWNIVSRQLQPITQVLQKKCTPV
jgi:hypothetical protein